MTTQVYASTAAVSGENNAITTEIYLKIVYIIIGALGLVGNTFVVFIIFSTTSMRKVVTNTFIINQSIVDGLAGFFLILVTLFEDSGRYLSGTFDEMYCRVWLTRGPLWASFMNSSLNLMFITMERFVAVWKPLWYKTSLSRKKVFVGILCGWVIGPFVTLLYGGMTSYIEDGNCYVYRKPGVTSLFLGAMVVSLQFVIPLAIFIICYPIIALILHQQQMLLKQRNSSSGSNPTVHGGKNIIKTMSLVCLCFVLCWSTNQVYYCLYLAGHTIDFSSAFYHFSVVATFVNCCCNPFVYIFQYREFQTAIKKIFSCSKTKINPHRSTNQPTSTL